MSAERPAAKGRRYRVVFTPVGWQVVDTREAKDPVAEFGNGHLEYTRATAEARKLNAQEAQRNG